MKIKRDDIKKAFNSGNTHAIFRSYQKPVK